MRPYAAAMLRRSLCAALVACLAPLTLTLPNAQAGPSGQWTSVSGLQADLGPNIRPSTLRDSDGSLHVVYAKQDTPSSWSIRYVNLTGSGDVARSSMVVEGWSAVTADPALVITPTGLRVAFSGRLGGSDATDAYNTGAVYDATSTDSGASWVLQPRYLSRSVTAATSQSLDAVDLPNGQTITVFGRDSTIRIANVVVTGAPVGEDPQFALPACCVRGIDVVRVPGTDQVWASWAVADSTASVAGYFVRQLEPVFGPVLKAPGSADGLIPVPATGDTGLTAQPDGSIHLIYPLGGYDASGNAVTAAVGVWRVGSVAPFQMQTTDVQYVDLDADGDGRLWATWASGPDVYAARSNPAVTRFAPPVNLGSVVVGDRPSTFDLSIAPRSGGGVADVLINTTRQVMHEEAQVGLDVAASPRRVKVGKPTTVTFTVAVAGERIRGATVQTSGQRCTTSADGTCKVTIRARKKKPFLAYARLATYRPGAVTLITRR